MSRGTRSKTMTDKPETTELKGIDSSTCVANANLASISEHVNESSHLSLKDISDQISGLLTQLNYDLS